MKSGLIVAAHVRQFPFYENVFASQIWFMFPREESFLASESCFSLIFCSYLRWQFLISFLTTNLYFSKTYLDIAEVKKGV